VTHRGRVMRKELDSTQIEQLKQIGASLESERQQQGVSLEEVAVKTYIPLRLLQALEEGQIDRLPEPVFIQGFIRRYADVLGLNGTELSKTFVTEPAPVMSMLPELETIAAPPPAQKIRTALSSERSDDRPYPAYLPKLALGGAAVLLVGFGAVSLLNRPKATSPTAATPATSRSSSPEPAPPSPAAQPVQIDVEAVEEAWVWVEVDGKGVFEQTLKLGEKKTWTAQKSIKLGSGNAGGVRFSYNKGEPKLLGALGATTEISLPPN
jgi:cytoskeleton protein RodZ